MKKEAYRSNLSAIAAAIAIMVDPAQASQWCTGTSEVFGIEGLQVTDDSNKAMAITRMIMEHSDMFDF